MPSPVRLMVLRYCLGMIMSVSTLIIWSGAATPSRVVNLSIKVFLGQHYCPSGGLFLAARRLPVKPALRNPASLVTCPKLKRCEATQMSMAEAVSTISVTKLHPVIGAEVKGVDLSRPLDAATIQQIKEAWYRHTVL